MSRPLAIASLLALPAFVVFDADTHNSGKEATNRRDNGCILRLLRHDSVEPLPAEHFFAENVVMWKETIGRAVLEEVGEKKWTEAETEARSRSGLEDGVKRKHPMVIAATLEVLAEGETHSELLARLCDRLLEFAAGRQDDDGGTAPK